MVRNMKICKGITRVAKKLTHTGWLSAACLSKKSPDGRWKKNVCRMRQWAKVHDTAVCFQYHRRYMFCWLEVTLVEKDAALHLGWRRWWSRGWRWRSVSVEGAGDDVGDWVSSSSSLRCCLGSLRSFLDLFSYVFLLWITGTKCDKMIYRLNIRKHRSWASAPC